jgi:hypothetical protein
MAPCVHHGHDEDEAGIDAIVDGIRKALDEPPANVSVDHWIPLRLELYPSDAEVHMVAKAIAEALPLVFVE